MTPKFLVEGKPHLQSSLPMSRVFVSYRRSDSGDAVRSVIDALQKTLPQEAIFFDQVSILPGQDFRLHVYEALQRADLVIVAFGPSWREQFSERARVNGGDSNEDHLLIEVETAIRLGKLVLPLVVAGVEEPTAKQLPPTIRELARRNIRVIDPNSTADVEGFAAEVLELLRIALRGRIERISNLTGLSTMAIELVLNAVRAVALDGSDDGSASASSIWESTKRLALTNYGDEFDNAMRKMKLQKSEDVGGIIACLMLDGILEREPMDEPSDFWDLGTIGGSE